MSRIYAFSHSMQNLKIQTFAVLTMLQEINFDVFVFCFFVFSVNVSHALYADLGIGLSFSGSNVARCFKCNSSVNLSPASKSVFI